MAWNQVPVDSNWSLTERRGYLRLRALPARDLWQARNTLTQRAIGPRSTVTAVLETAGLKSGDVAGLALFNRPYGWIGVERKADGQTLVMFDEVTGRTSRLPWNGTRVWLRAECDFIRNIATFLHSSDGKAFTNIGEPHTMAYGLITFQGVRYSLFSYNSDSGTEAGYADFDSLAVQEQSRKRIPYGNTVEFTVRGGTSKLEVGGATRFLVTDQKLGRISLRTDSGYVSVDPTGAV